MPAFALARPAGIALSAELSATGDVALEEAPLSWATAMSYLELKEIPGQTQKNFAAWAESELPGTYPSGLASGYWSNTIDAFSDGDYDPVAQKVYWFGGGHQDSACNGLFAFDPLTLEWSVVIQPTPYAKFPPAYITAGGVQSWLSPVEYPNTTEQPWYFQSALTLDGADIAYATAEAPVTRHTYGSVAAGDGKVHLFFQTYARADVASGVWDWLRMTSPPAPSGDNYYSKNLSNPYGPQILANGWGTENAPFEINTQATIDKFDGYAYVQNNGRGGVVKIDTATQTVMARVASFGAPYQRIGTDATHVFILGQITGRPDLPAFLNQSGDYGNGSYNALVIADKATNTSSYVALTGEVCSYFPTVSTAEEVPAFFDGTYFWLWPYYTEPGFVYRVDCKGTVGQSTKLALTTTGTLPTVSFKYKLHYIPEANCAIFCANSTAGWWAIKTA